MEKTSPSPDPKHWALSVKAVIRDEAGRCLLVRRSDNCKNFVGVWEWPGGKLDPGEDFAEGLVREVFEETGLQVALGDFVGASSFEMQKVRVVLLCMEARVVGGTLRVSEEHDESAWVPMEELPNWTVVEPMKPVIQALLNPTTPHARQTTHPAA
ncbi:MAG TPA: NUDIX domain-containing protein [Verrucomicrobiae bacterium]|nr:NUDIX domain-containing protein [Verrucomicrobiae bacterium]